MRRILLWASVLLVFIVAALTMVAIVGVKYAYEPSRQNILSRNRASPEFYDLWGHAFSQNEANQLLQTNEGRAQLSPRNGAVKIDEALLRLGRRAFYKETFGNEIFLTDVVGILDGPMRVTNLTKAVLALHGRSTTNLRVEVPETVTIGNRTFEKGSFFDTGLDVPAGALVPLGMSISVSGLRIRVGITCAACHATVDPESGKVIEGAPNQDLDAGLLLALGTNSASYFMHTDVSPLRDIPRDANRTVISSAGQKEELPNIDALERGVDTALLMWPRGNFDSLTDMKADPTQNPVSFTWGNHPYGWSGNFMAGPFRGLTSQNNNVHALNSDSLLLADSSSGLLDIDKEVYLAILLENAAYKRYRFEPSDTRKPSEFLASVKPDRESPGVNRVVLSPTYPKGTLLSPDGTFTSSPGYTFWQQNNAMAAWQDTIVPPPARIHVDAAVLTLGRRVFERARCPACHSGPFLTNNSVVSSGEIGTNPVRGMALQKTEKNFANPVVYTFDTRVPLPAHAKQLQVPTLDLDAKQVDLAWAHNGSGGGYKVPALVGLYWTAPYLHDGGVAVGKNADVDLGLPGTVEKNMIPDPVNSLRALVDRELRARVVAANEASADLRRMNVQGIGHNFWVDAQSGFTDQEQTALILYLLSYEPGSWHYFLSAVPGADWPACAFATIGSGNVYPAAACNLFLNEPAMTWSLPAISASKPSFATSAGSSFSLTPSLVSSAPARWKKFVSVAPGINAVTVTPVSFNSSRSPSDNERTNALVAP